jgi:hypothetical protein
MLHLCYRSVLADEKQRNYRQWRARRLLLDHRVSAQQHETGHAGTEPALESLVAPLDLSFTGATIAAALLEAQRRFCTGCGLRRPAELYTA